MKIKKSVIVFMVLTMLAVVYIIALPANAASPESDFRFNAATGTITGYTGPGSTVEIPATIGGVPVTAIGDLAFRNKSAITRIIIPNGVTSIGKSAFTNCTGLMVINIPNSVTGIGPSAFWNCKELIKVNLPSGVTAIEDSTFHQCAKLAEVTIPEGVSYIARQAFYSCAALTEINIPNGVTSIGDSAFVFCASLNIVTLPDSLTEIGLGAFQGCTNLSGITLPENLKSIGKRAFSECENLSGTITIPSGITGIDEYTFYKCENLDAVVLPDSVTGIGRDAFMACYKLTGIKLPNDISSIGDWAFESCTGLTSIDIPASVTNIGAGAFWGCTGLTSITIPDGVTSIKGSTFGSCTGLTDITIPESVTSIGYNAFSYCHGLTEITIPRGVTSIGYRAFKFCENLSRAVFMGDTPIMGDDIIGEDVFRDCSPDFAVGYLFGNESFTGSIIDGKWNGYDAIPMVTVTYDGNGGESGDVPEDKNLYEAGNAAIVCGNPGVLNKTGFNLKGWNTKADGSGTTYDEGDSVEIDGTGHVTLYAVWEAITVISVEVTWGSMEFTYSDGTWNPETHEYEGVGWMIGENANKISVTSTSNVPVTVSYLYEQEPGYESVNGSFTDGINPMIISKNLPAGDITPQSCNAYLTLSGKPSECNISKIGSVTVTIAG